ncbi:MAG: class I SAM-dependent methyltransferase [bacterium]|nr:class I SAM-dependent methyltransferase [bacterium]
MNKQTKTFDRIMIERARTLYQEPDILAHFSNPDRNINRKGLCAWELSLCKEYIQENGHILVIGCAGGQESFVFLRAGYQVTGVDIVPEFIEAARKQANKKGFKNSARFELVNDFQWPVRDGTCDAVSMLANFLTYLPSRDIRKTVFKECFRVLKPGGVVMMQGADRTHPNINLKRPKWEPKRIENLKKKQEWNLMKEKGVEVKLYHPCKGDVNAKTLVPNYSVDPREIWKEVEKCNLRIIRFQGEQNPESRFAFVTLVAVKD